MGSHRASLMDSGTSNPSTPLPTASRPPSATLNAPTRDRPNRPTPTTANTNSVRQTSTRTLRTTPTSSLSTRTVHPTLNSPPPTPNSPVSPFTRSTRHRPQSTSTPPIPTALPPPSPTKCPHPHRSTTPLLLLRIPTTLHRISHLRTERTSLRLRSTGSTSSNTASTLR